MALRPLGHPVLQILQELVGRDLGLFQDPVECTDCYLSMKGYNTPNLADSSRFLQHDMAAALSNLYESEPLQSTNRLMPRYAM
jgi:hypothetical protein